ncbi:polyubiquitin-B-like isoform X2 [Centropristis striata]|uniref:polyubiquitin-B-like isoform X2 n=1 Tax=Centropristis striata TaxID=184440 RepID=UPI0027E0E615|nr:polyubiquitin-B-like isoform X2 [Centropristis striata]
MEINIKMLDGACHTLQVNPNDTVASLKIRIQEKLGVSRDTQKLMFVNGQNTDLNDDSKPLSWYGLHSGVTVSLLVIQPVNKPVQETVSSFKSKVQSREGPAVSQQVLAHQGRVMDGGKLSDYNVTELSTIDLTLRLRGG